MTEPVAQPGADHDSRIDRLAERVEDLTRVIARQAATIDRLADEAKARAKQDRAGADLPLLVELFALHGDTAACATTAESSRERAAFEAITARVERLILGRGGALVTPRPGDAFDAITMEAAEVRAVDDPGADRTLAAVIQPGLIVAGRSVRPAGVVVHRYRASDTQPDKAAQSPTDPANRSAESKPSPPAPAPDAPTPWSNPHSQ